MDWISLAAIFIALLLAGLFSGLESAFISANKLSIELNRKQGTTSGKIWGKFSDFPTRFIGTILVSFNMALVMYGLLIGDLLEPIWLWLQPRIPESAKDYLVYIRLLVETILATGIVLFVEFTSRAIFRSNNKGILQSGIISRVAAFFYWLFSTVAGLLVNLSEWMLKYIFNVKIQEKQEPFNKYDLEHYLQQSQGIDEEEPSNLNKTLFENALSLSEVKVRECLIPRKEIVSVDTQTPLSAIREKFISTKLSKLVVYDQSIDNIVGYVHHLDMFKNPHALQAILHPIPTVPESMSATDLMNKFSVERKSIAWVVDEFGGTAGIVTMEDLLEEIFGDIKDEYDDADTLIEKQITPVEYIFSGRIKLDYLREKYGFQFPQNEKEAETLSGYIIQKNEAIPRQKQRIIVGNFEFEPLSVSGTRIEMVKLKLLI